jgi:4-hydroxyphenylpyruvate dioxygenase
MTDIPLRKIDHVRFFVGNARQSAFFYRNSGRAKSRSS